jgi:HD-GYP domain-containing protein (c-di-GMP phosphodiesterase class II)
METTSFLPIQSLDIEAERRITFDLYLNLPLNNRVILYRRKGGALESDRLARLAEGNLQNFWIRKEDYNEFVRYVAGRLKALIDHPDPAGNRHMMVAAAKAILSSTFQSDDSAMVNALMGNLNEITGVLIESVLENTSPARRKSFSKLMQLSEKGSDFHKHPVNVSSLSVMIAFGIGYSTDRILSELAMGALLHDVGLAKLPSKVATSAHDLLSLTFEERRELYKHGQYAIEILEQKKIPLTEVMRAIIIQHHEQFNGSGYPAGLRGYVINEFAQIVRVADELDHLVRHELDSAETLRRQVTNLFNQLHDEKIIAPELATRIRKLFLDF